MWAGMELGQKITVWGLAVMLACGAAYIAIASPTLSAVSQSGGASLGDLGATRVRESVWLTLASAAGTSLMVLAITDRHEQAARRSIAGVGSSVSLIACIAWAGLSLASSEAELAAVWWASSVLFGVVAVATSVAIVVVGLRVAQRFMRGWHDGADCVQGGDVRRGGAVRPRGQLHADGSRPLLDGRRRRSVGVRRRHGRGVGGR